MSWLGKRFRDFDPRSADAFDCWAVVQMETEGYVRINRGKIAVTEKGRCVSPKSTFQRRPPRWHCNLSKAMLVMEQDGLLTVRNGNIKLTPAGQAEYGGRNLVKISALLKETRDFDPRKASPDVCWGLLVLEEHGYVSVRRGFVVSGESGEEVSLPGSFEKPCSDADSFLSKVVLVLDAMGLVTIRRGLIQLSEAGIKEYAKIDLANAGQSAGGDASASDGGGHHVEISERISDFIGRCVQDNESANDVIWRLMAMSECSGAARD